MTEHDDNLVKWVLIFAVVYLILSSVIVIWAGMEGTKKVELSGKIEQLRK